MKKDSHIIYDILKQRVLVLDGAMGTMIQNLKFDESDIKNIDSKASTELNEIAQAFHVLKINNYDNLKKQIAIKNS